jgi:hypothetical protein
LANAVERETEITTQREAAEEEYLNTLLQARIAHGSQGDSPRLCSTLHTGLIFGNNINNNNRESDANEVNEDNDDGGDDEDDDADDVDTERIIVSRKRSRKRNPSPNPSKSAKKKQ